MRRAEDVGEGLVQRPGLAVVVEVRRELDDAMAELVPTTSGEAAKSTKIMPSPLPIVETDAVPERVVEGDAEVDVDVDRHSGVVGAVAVEDVLE